MAPSELASEKSCCPSRLGRSPDGGRPARLGARAAQAPCRGLGVASGPPSDQPRSLPRAGSRLRRGHAHGSDRQLARGLARRPSDPDT
eukprot:3719485-Pleurochrysis_carterae.AAC.2